MLNALRRNWTSQKVQTALVGIVIAAGAKFGLDVSDVFAVALLGFIGILIHAQGQTDHGKAAAMILAGSTIQRTSTAPNESGGTTQITTTAPVAPNPAAIDVAPATAPTAPTAFGMLAVLLVGCAALTSCGSSLSGKGAMADALNCLTPAVTSAIKTYGPTTDQVIQAATEANGSILTDKLDDAFKNFATDEAKCVALNSIAKLLTPAPTNPNAPASAPQVVSPDVARATFESFRMKLNDGKPVNLPSGTF